MKKCLVYFEPQYESVAIDLLEVSRWMFGEDFESVALFVNSDSKKAIGKFDRIIKVENQNIQEEDIRNTTDIIGELQDQFNFDSILIPATHFGRMLAPRLAMKLGVGLVADVTEIKEYQKDVEMVRPAFDGKIMAGIINSGGIPVMMSVRPGVFRYEVLKHKETVTLDYSYENIKKSGIKRTERKIKPETEDIREGKVLIAGGGGILGNFHTIENLAKALNGMKAASRKVVDSGKADRNIQVGQSGKIVSPDLYIALGIYGSLQHVAGLNKVKHLIAVNTNKDAPICSLADIVVEGDAQEFVKKLVDKINHGR
ncbi:MAG: electron transfer flavoprotein subunit alpha/FixB family protein [Eubacteriaceae bacterium]